MDYKGMAMTAAMDYKGMAMTAAMEDKFGAIVSTGVGSMAEAVWLLAHGTKREIEEALGERYGTMENAMMYLAGTASRDTLSRYDEEDAGFYHKLLRSIRHGFESVEITRQVARIACDSITSERDAWQQLDHANMINAMLGRSQRKRKMTAAESGNRTLEIKRNAFEAGYH